VLFDKEAKAANARKLLESQRVKNQRKQLNTNPKKPPKAAKDSDAVAKAPAKATTYEPPDDDSTAKASEKTFGSEITASQEENMVQALDLCQNKAKAKQKKQQQDLLHTPSSSNNGKTTSNGPKANKGKSNPKLSKPFTPTSKAETTAKAPAIAASSDDAPATARINSPDTDESIEAHERKLKHQAKTWTKADNAIDKGTFYQVTANAFETHTNSTLITNLIVELTSKLHQLTRKVSFYQAKASKFEDLPHWVPKSCKSGFALSAPQDIPDDDTGLTNLRAKVATIRHSYEKALRDCVNSKEMLLLNAAMKERREEFVTKSLDIATYWLCLWLPKNQKLFKKHPLTIKEDQIVGIVFERFLTGNPSELLQELNFYFNAELNFLYMLPASIRSQQRFRSEEDPEKRIFRNRNEAAAATMYPFTKVTWGHDDYDKLEAAIRIIEPHLNTFLSTLCAETTFKFQQAYEAELNSKLAELKVAARQKKLAAFSAANETAKALAAAHQQAHETVKETIDRLTSQVHTLQRTQQRQGERLKTAKAPTTTTNNKQTPKQKNLQGGRGKGPSVEPKASVRDNRNGKKPNLTPPNNRQTPNNKRKTPDDTPSTDISSAKLKKQQQRKQKQKQYKRQKLLDKKRQHKLKAKADKQVAAPPADAAATQPDNNSNG
jgi:hypothetical protein